MSGRVCYLARSDRGGRIAHLRLVGERSDEFWTPPAAPPDGAAPVRASIDAAAAWLADRVPAGGGGPRSLPVLCVDVDGAHCSWLSAPSDEPAVVAAALLQREGGDLESSLVGAGVGTGEVSVQALSTPAPGGAGLRLLPGRSTAGRSDAAKRLAVLSVPDTTARLLIDALDDRGIAVESAVSLWHAIALAWDPGAPGSAAGPGARAERIVASSTPVTAVVLIDPLGRLVWSWAREGELIASGTIRLLVETRAPDRREGPLARVVDEGQAEPGAPRIGRDEVGRLTADWLAWSAQLGQAPARILCLGPDAGGGEDRLTPGELGAALGEAWPGAAVDLAVHDDPVGATLLRLARGVEEAGEAAEGARSSLVALSHRPGRAHRSLYRWASAAVLAGAAALGVVGWKTWQAAKEAEAEAAALRARTDARIGEVIPALATDPFARNKIADHVAQLRMLAQRPPGINPPKPILAELETLSYAIGGTSAQVQSIQLTENAAIVQLTVPDLSTADDVVVALSSIGGSRLEWTRSFRDRSGGRYELTLTGVWKPQPAEAGGGRRAAGGGF